MERTVPLSRVLAHYFPPQLYDRRGFGVFLA